MTGPTKHDERTASKLVLVPVAILALCCALPTLIAAGVLAGIGAWLGAHGAWVASGVVILIAVALVFWRTMSPRRHAGGRGDER